MNIIPTELLSYREEMLQLWIPLSYDKIFLEKNWIGWKPLPFLSTVFYIHVYL